MLKRSLLFFLLSCCVLVSACNSGNGHNNELFSYDKQSLTIEIVTEMAGPGARRSNQEFYNRIMKFSEDRPQVEINIRSSSNSSRHLSPWLIGWKGAGDPPDIVELTPTQMKIWHMHGKLEPLSMNEPELQNIVITSADGYVIGIKNRMNPLLIYYNKDIFTTLGLEFPSDQWDWVKFDDTITALKAAGQNVYIPISTYILEWLTVNRYGGTIVEPGSMIFSGYLDSDAAVHAAEWLVWVGTRDEDYKPRKWGHDTFYDPFPLDLVEGNMALGIHFSYGINIDSTGNYEAILKRNEQIGIAPLPGGPNTSTIARMTGYGIYADSPNKAIAMEFIRYLVESEDFFEGVLTRMSRTDESTGLEESRIVMEEMRRSEQMTLHLFESVNHGFDHSYHPLRRAIMNNGQSASEALKLYADEVESQIELFRNDLEEYASCIRWEKGLCRF